MSVYTKKQLYNVSKKFTYAGRKMNEISFPLGGIGTGCIGLAGNGRLIDWELFNKPSKGGTVNGLSFFAIKAEHQGQLLTARVLNSDLNPPYIGKTEGILNGYGFGVFREYMTGMPHFKDAVFTGEFPFAEIKFVDDSVPLNVKLKAFNPYIPLNDKDSSIPAAIFVFEVENTYDHELDISLVGTLTNPLPSGRVNHYFDHGAFKGLKLHSVNFNENDPEFGDLTLSTDASDTSYQSYLFRTGWFEPLTIFWEDFITPGRFKERYYEDVEKGSNHVHLDASVLAVHKTLQPGEKAYVRYVISWSFPNFVNYWDPNACTTSCSCSGGEKKQLQWKNYYATLFKDSVDSSSYVYRNFDRLYEETLEFKNTLFASTLPDYVIDAISSNISILKTPTCIRLTDGTLYGFEGTGCRGGCCEGSCTHVWNYAQALPFLFPALERSMHNVMYEYNQFENGKMPFRLTLPPGREKWNAIPHAAVDGQMGEIIRVYRDWIISGDTKWLKSIWPKVKKALEYAWDPRNEDWWDKNCDGVIEGVQHHTLDVNMYGPNTYLTGYYLGALLAASKLAEALEDQDAKKYYEIFERGSKWVNENLFNGEYFFQKIDLADPTFPVDPELGEIRYQMGEGCHIDQVIGQWQCHISDLGYIFDKDKLKTALGSLYKYNFITNMREFANPCRIFALNDEKALVICTWPKGKKPKAPLQYGGESMNGFEYQAACHMIYEGLVDEGLSIVKAIRERYDGERRNPWNEFECGSNYARSMASYSLLLALSGFKYNLVEGSIGFNPRINVDNFRSFWSLGTGWGEFSHKKGNIQLNVKSGQLAINSFQSELLNGKTEVKIFIGRKPLTFYRLKGDCIVFDHTVELKDKNVLKIVLQ